MKKVYTVSVIALIFSFFIPVTAQSQFILGMTVNPQNPTTNDQVQIIAHVGFPSGDCIEKSLWYTSAQNSFQANALHCLGLAAFICYDYDTFNLGTLSAGSYTFNFQLDAGQGMMPCTPGINPGPIDSISFVVNFPTGIATHYAPELEIGPIPARGTFQVINTGKEVVNFSEIIVFQSNGSPVIKFKSIAPHQPLDISTLSAGWYLVQLETAKGQRTYRKLLIY